MELVIADDVIELHSAQSGETIIEQICSVSSILQILKHEPATAYELEIAIEEVENHLMPVLRRLPRNAELYTLATGVIELFSVLGVPALPGAVVEISQVEELFNSLADIAMGTPVSQRAIPVTHTFTAVLLFVRELMHHGGLKYLIIGDSSMLGDKSL